MYGMHVCMSSLLPWFLFFRCFSIRFVILSFILLFCLVSASVGLFPSILLCVSFGSVTLFSLTPQFLQAGLSLYISFSLSLFLCSLPLQPKTSERPPPAHHYPPGRALPARLGPGLELEQGGLPGPCSLAGERAGSAGK